MAISSARAREGRQTKARSTLRRPLDASELAWLAVLPCAALLAVAIVLLGPPLGHALFEPAGVDRFWPETEVRPEPVEHARFVLALLAAPLGAAGVLVLARRPPPMRPDFVGALVRLAQACTALFVVLMLLAQRGVLLRAYVYPVQPRDVFSLTTLAAAAAFALAASYGLRRPLATRLRGLVRETSGRRVACLVAAIALVAVWLTAAFNTEHSIGRAESNHLIPWDMSETFAVLDGRTPLVDFHSQYAQLLPYIGAGALRIFGSSVGSWTGAMIVLSGLALLAVFAVLRRVVRGSLTALALFVPFLAGSAYLIDGRLSPFEIFALWPMRYAGPYLLAWLTARHLDGATPRARWLLLSVGGLVAINNLEFGLPACAGTLAAIVYVAPPRSRRAALRLLGDAAAGLLGAVAVVTAIALLHGGALPHFKLLLEFPRIYGIGGWVLEPMTAAGLHMVLYATFVAAVVVATVRAVRGDNGRVLTGMLVWSGLFGLGAGSYFAGRSDTLNLISLFSAWCFAVVLLTIVVVERIAIAGRRPSVADLVVLFGVLVVACSVFQMPRPWNELARLRRTTAAIYKQADAVQLVSETTTPGEKVAILTQLGHRVALDAHVTDVAPYSGLEAMPTVGQMQTTLAAVRREGVSTIYVQRSFLLTGMLEALQTAGFAPVTQRGDYIMLRASGPSP